MGLLNKASNKIRLWYQDYLGHYIHNKCKIRYNDLIVGSYQKSGRTWVRFFVGSYICNLYELGYDVDWTNFTSLTPDRYCSEKELLGFPETVPHRVIFSHDRPIGRYFPDRKLIYITRKLTDIIVSYYHFHKNRERPEYGKYSLDEFAVSKFPLNEAVDKLNYFSQKMEQARDLRIISYESLKSNSEARFKEMIDFSAHPFDEEAFRKAIQRSSFESMRSLEEKQRGRDDEEGYHTRKGKSGESKEVLSNEAIENVNQYLDKNLKGMLKDYYIKGKV